MTTEFLPTVRALHADEVVDRSHRSEPKRATKHRQSDVFAQFERILGDAYPKQRGLMIMR